MLVAFSVENYKGFKEEQTLTFVASLGDEHASHLVNLDNGLRLSKVAAIIGGNGVGKSQLLDAIINFSRAIHSDNIENLHKPFLFNEDCLVSPTNYEVIVLDENKQNFLRYGISVLKNKVLYEYLYSRPVKKGAKESTIFYRDGDKLEFKSEYKKQERLITPVLKAEGLVSFFSKSLEIKELDGVRRWSISQIQYNPENHKKFGFDFIESQLQDNMEYLVKEDAGVNIDAKDTIKKEYINRFLATYNEFIKKAPLNIDSVSFLPVGENGKHHFIYHIENDNKTMTHIYPGQRYDFFSQGTLNVLAFVLTLLWANANRFTLYVDEIDSSVHHSLANKLLKVVIDNTCQIDNMQFVFTTHNISLIDDCIRRDELNIIFKEKDKTAKLINASSFAVRKDAKLSAKYFRGEFGQVPYFFSKED